MGRLLLAIVAVFLFACDESDPSTSEHCVKVRMQYIEVKYHRDQAAKYGQPVGDIDVGLARLQNENWQCFK